MINDLKDRNTADQKEMKKLADELEKERKKSMLDDKKIDQLEDALAKKMKEVENKEKAKAKNEQEIRALKDAIED